MRNKFEANHVPYRDGVYYYVRRAPHHLTSHYDVKRLCFSLKTESFSAAIRASRSVPQRLEDYWHRIYDSYGNSFAKHQSEVFFQKQSKVSLF